MPIRLLEVTGDRVIDRNFQLIATLLNELEEKVGKDAPPGISDTEGKIGAIKVTKLESGSYVVYVKSSDGWLASEPLTFKLVSEG